MRIFHTSNLIVSKPDVYHSREHLDFGEGMYLTYQEKQARDYGQRFIRRGEATVNCFHSLFPYSTHTLPILNEYA